MQRSALIVFGVMTVVLLSSEMAKAACDPAVEKQVTAALDTYLDGLNAKDPASWAASLNYPQVRIRVGAAPEVWPTAEAYGAAFATAQAFRPTWDHSIWSSTEVPWCTADAAYARVHSLQVDATDAVQDSLLGVFVLTRRGGRWGVQARFSDLVPAEGELRADAVRGARHGLEEYLAAQQRGSREAMAAAANLPLVTIVDGGVAEYASPSAVLATASTGGLDLCGPLPEISEALLADRSMVIMTGHVGGGAANPGAPLPNLYVLTDQDGHWGLSGCAAFSGTTSREGAAAHR